MRIKLFIAGGLVAMLAAMGAALAWQLTQTGQPAQPARSPYVDQVGSHVRGLSDQEVDDLFNGRGMGYARTAELNNYPGPRHVLDLKSELGLSAEQVEQVEAAFKAMQAEAKELGQMIVHEEMLFSTAFADGTISSDALQRASDELADLYGKLRAIHLQAHLQITPLLTPEQIARYNTLRGYSSATNQITPNSNNDHQHKP